MVCTANDLLGWRDFPKGLRVLLLDEDSSSANEIRSKLEGMDYIVYTFCNEDEALSAISNQAENFHIAIVEVSSSNSHGRFTLLEAVKDLPTIMTSKMQCLTTMMKCIALGAVEFLLKPLSDDKLRNIWQHVVHKAFNAGGNNLSKSLKPVKESVVSMLHLLVENGEQKSSISTETENEPRVEVNGKEQSVGSDEYPAPPNPQLKQGARLVDDGDCQDQANCSTDKQGRGQCGESKSVDNTCGNLVADATVEGNPPQRLEGAIIKEENESPDGCKIESTKMSSRRKLTDAPSDSGCDAGNHVKASKQHSSCGNKSNRKKMKVDWTPELHKKFVRSVEKLGVDQAIPSRILELMKVEGLTRHNVASHLQKYRRQRRHMLPNEDVKRSPHLRETSQRSYYAQKPVMAFPPYHSNPTYPAWSPSGSYIAGVQTWGPSFYPPWQPAESWHWKSYPGMDADAWGCPVMLPPPYGPCPAFPQAEEEIDKVVKEAIRKPWLPLPLGLKPPSTDSVLAELSKQGISSIPPY